MKRNLIALAALTSMVSSVALADTANVNVYGTINTSVDYSKATSVATGTTDMTYRPRLVCNSCNFGIKGTEEITEGLKGIWQIESSLNFKATGTLAARNTGIGLNGGWGTLMFGNWDTPYKTLAAPLEPTWGTGAAYMAALMDNASTGTSSFSLRQKESIWYISPKFSGADFTFLYSPVQDKSLSNPNPGLYSTTLKYDQDMFLVGAGYEKHMNVRSASTSDNGLKFVGGVRPIDGLFVGAAWAQTTYETVDVTSTKASKFQASAKYKMDQWDFAFSFTSAGDTKTTPTGGTETTNADTGATHLGAKVGYNYSKRTDVYLAWAKLDNKTNANYNFALGDSQFASTGAPFFGNGTDLTTFSFGVRHTF